MATANTEIKITSLPNIGNAIAPSTLIPVVNMAGAPVTQKANLQITGNLILAGAGTANFVPARLANLAYSVVNAAQPNITSTGTLNVNTLKVSGGINGQYLQTDGTGNLAWVSGGGSGNGEVGGSDTQIQFNNAGNFGGSSGLTWNGSTGLLSTLQLSVATDATIYGNTALTNLNVAGNLTTNNIFTDNYYYANGDPFSGGGGNGTPGGSNTQIQFNDAGNFNGNTGFTFNKTTGIFTSPFLVGNGNGLSNIQGANVSGFVPNANVANTAFAVAGANVSGFVPNANVANTAFAVAGANVSGFVPNANVANTAFAVAAANVSGLGNIATINLTGSNSNVLYGNGVFAAVAGGGANTGNVTFDNINIIGTGNLHLQPDPADAGAYLDIYLTGAADIHVAAGAAGANLILGTDEEANIAILQGGNVAIQAGNVSGTQTWTFDTTGDINIPPNATSFQTGRIQSANGYPTLLAYGSGSHGGPELNWMDGDNPNNIGNADVLRNTLYLNGDEGLYVGMNENNVANTFTGSWRFAPDGTTTFPTANIDLHNGGVQSAEVLQFGSNQQSIITGPTPSANVSAQRLIIQGQRGNGTGEGGDVYVWAGDADTNGGDIKIYAGDADNVSSGTGGYINLAGGDGFDNGGHINIDGGSSANATGGQVSILGGFGQIDGGTASLQGGYGQTGQGGAVQITGGGSSNGTGSFGNVVLGSGVSGWIFDNTGNLTIPGNIIGAATIAIDNRDSGTTADINLYSADDILIQARDRAIGSTSEGGDINIYAGNSAEDGDTSAGDIVIEAGSGGASNVDYGGAGGFVRIDAGDGGEAIGASFSARPGGNLTLRAGDAGDNNSNIDLGATGGDITMQAGDSTGNGVPGGSVYIRSGNGDPSAEGGPDGDVVIQAGSIGSTWTFGGTGNLTLPSNTFDVNYANGTQVSIGGGANTGNVTFDNINIIGDGNLHLQPDPANAGAYLNIYLTAGPGPDIHIAGNGETVILGTDNLANVAVNVDGNVSIQASNGTPHTWTFGTDGTTTFPRDASNISTDPILTIAGGANPSITSTDASLAGPANLAMSVDFLNISGFNGNKIVAYPDQGALAADANMVLLTNFADQANISAWTFDTTGNLTLPGGGTIYGNPFTPSGAPGNTITLQPAGSGTITDQRLLIYPTGGDGDHIHLTSGNLYQTELFLGSDNFYVKLANTGNVVVNTNDNAGNTAQWTFDTAGNVTIPGNIIGAATIAIDNRDSGTTADIQLYSADDILIKARDRTLGSGSPGGDINIYAGDSAEDGDTGAGDIIIQAGAGGASNIDYGGAGGAISISAGNGGDAIGGSVSALNGGDLVLTAGDAGDNNGNINLGGEGGDVTMIAGDSTGNGIPGGSVYIKSGNGDSDSEGGPDGNVEIQIGSNGSTWTFSGDGNLTLPANTVAINFANGASAFGNIVATNLDGSSSNVLYGNGIFSAVPAPTVAQDISSNGAMSIMTYDGNLKYVNYATVEPSTGNIAGGNISTTGNLSAGNANVTGNINAGNVSATTFTGALTGLASSATVAASANAVAGANVSGQVGNALVAGTVYTNAQPNITSVGTLTSISVTGNANVGNLGTSGLIVATGNITGGNLVTAGALSVTGNANVGNLGTGRVIATGNISGTQLISNIAIGTAPLVVTSTTRVANLSVDYANVADFITVAAGTGNNFIIFANAATGNVSEVTSTGITANLSTNAITATTFVGALANGNSNVNIATANGNVTITAVGNTTMTVTGTGANITGNLNVTGNISGNTNGFAIGYLNIPQVAAANATLALTDAGKHYYSTTAGNLTLTIPTNANVAFATGTAVSIVVQAAGNILVNAASGVTLYMAGNSTAANRVVSTYGMATLMKVASDTWFINGTGVA